jgi:hypothetical protein
VARVNRDERKIDFVILEDDKTRGTRRKRPVKGRKDGPKKGRKGRKSRATA